MVLFTLRAKYTSIHNFKVIKSSQRQIKTLCSVRGYYVAIRQSNSWTDIYFKTNKYHTKDNVVSKYLGLRLSNLLNVKITLQ